MKIRLTYYMFFLLYIIFSDKIYRKIAILNYILDISDKTVIINV